MNQLLTSDDLLQDIWVSGEIPRVSISAAGHAYFTLRDGDSALSCVMFRNSRGMNYLKDGAAVIAHGRMSIYGARGDLQLVCDIAQPEGIGELQLKFEQLVNKLEKEGLFDLTRKRSIPAFPKRMGVITSEHGAVWQDIQAIVQRRYPLVEIVLAPTLVQGEFATTGIVDAFRAMNDQQNIDLIVVARGGGSLEDLWSFNEESVARAVFSSRAPVISAIGHETDHTICDMVADLRAPTPSAAAELAVPNITDLGFRITSGHTAMATSVHNQITQFRQDLDHLNTTLASSLPDFDAIRLKIDDISRIAETNIDAALRIMHQHSKATKLLLDSLDPSNVLRRGYAIVEGRDSHLAITGPSDVVPGDFIKVRVSRGDFDATVLD